MGLWSVDQVIEWLKTIGFDKHIATFKENHIDGHALRVLTKCDVAQLLIILNEDGTIKKPLIREIQRFQEALCHWKEICGQSKTKKPYVSKKVSNQIDSYEKATIPRFSVQPTLPPCKSYINQALAPTNYSKLSLVILPTKNESLSCADEYKQYKYLIDDHILVQFLKKPQFISYLINYIQKESFPIRIDIKEFHEKTEQLSYKYTIEFSSTQHEASDVCKVIEHIFGRLKPKIYRQPEVRKWLRHSRAVDIIQEIMDNEKDLFTVCKSSGNYNEVLEVYFFNDEKFNSFENIFRIDRIIYNDVLTVVLVLKLSGTKKIRTSKKNQKFDNSIKNDKSTDDPIIAKDQNQRAIQCEEELLKTVKQCNLGNGMISVLHCKKSTALVYKNQHHIQIFGNITMVNDVVQRIQDIKNKYSLKQYPLHQMNLTQINYLMNACRRELKAIEKQYKNDRVCINIHQSVFYAPPHLKVEIESRINILLSQMKTNTFKTDEFVYEIAAQASLHFQTIAQNNYCGCDFEIETKLISYSIPRAIETASTIYLVSKLIIQKSNEFCSLPNFHQVASLIHGSIEVVIGDIGAQKVDTIVIPSILHGLKESLVTRAGDIVQQSAETNIKNSIPFITETTAGRLNCKKILFVNWSLSRLRETTDEDILRQFVRKFISKVIQYVVMRTEHSNLQTQSIAFAVPDLYTKEKIIAEEMIHEAQCHIQSTKSIPIRIIFVILPNRKTLFQDFSSIISTMSQTSNTEYGIFLYPISTIKITLLSSNTEYLTKCQEKMNNYMKRCMAEIVLEDGFNDWNQHLINAYLKFCIDRFILILIKDSQKVILKGSVNALEEAKQKYQFTMAIVERKMHIIQSLLKSPTEISTSSFRATNVFTSDASISYCNVILSYSPKDSAVCHKLANRLIDEGCSVWHMSNEISNHSDTFSQIKHFDCTILCISENYVNDEQCEKEAKYAREISKQIILVKIQHCTLVEWTHQLLKNHIWFQIYGSENQFELVFDKLLLEMFKNISLDELSQKRQTLNVTRENQIITPWQTVRNSYIKMNVNERQLIYQMNVARLTSNKKYEITEDEKKIAIESIEDIINEVIDQHEIYPNKNYHEEHYSSQYNEEYETKQKDMVQQMYFDFGLLAYKHWLAKIPNLKTKQNVAPFTLSGDINDAPYPILADVSQNTKLLLRSYTKQSSPWTTSSSKMKLWDIAYTGPYRHQSTYFLGGATMYNCIHYSDTECYRSTYYTSWGIATEKQIRRRHDMIDSSRMIKRRHELGKYFMNSYKYVTEEKLKSCLEFGQRMKNNAIELTRLCELNATLQREQPQQTSQSSLRAIFSFNNEHSISEEQQSATFKTQNISKYSLKSSFNKNKHTKGFVLNNNTNFIKLPIDI